MRGAKSLEDLQECEGDVGKKYFEDEEKAREDRMKKSSKEAEAEAEAEVKPEAEAEVKPEAEAEAEAEVKPEAEAEAEAEVKPEAEAEAKVGTPEPDVKAVPDTYRDAFGRYFASTLAGRSVGGDGARTAPGCWDSRCASSRCWTSI